MSVHEAEIVQRPLPRVVRQYSQQERIKALAIYDNVGTLEQASEITGIPLSTLGGWVNDPHNYSELREKTAVALADKFEDAANKYIDLAMKKAKDAPFTALMTGAGIAVDKMQLLRNQPTSIVESLDRQELLVVIADAITEASANDMATNTTSSMGHR